MGKFDVIYDRKAYNCIKWSRNPYGHPDFIPMGIADMDFASPDFVIQAIKQRLEHPILGYFRPDKTFYHAILNWQNEQYQVLDLTGEDIIVQASVLGGVASAIEILTEKGDAVMVQAPGYFNFAQVISSLERKLIPNHLVWDGTGYQIDFEQMEKEMEENQVKAFLLCSPHNPTGRVWTREELLLLSEICERRQIMVIADEIWADIVYEGCHIPFQTVSEWAGNHTIALYAPTKTFNLAGITIAYAVVRNKELRQKFEKTCSRSHYNFPNLLSAEALIAAYEQGAEWKQELCGYLKENVSMAVEFFHENCPQVQVGMPQGTYLLWLDFKKTGLDSDVLLEILGKAGIYLNDGRGCIADGDCCLRMNAAVPREVLKKALKRIQTAIREETNHD